jgi:multiple antibiotic resistance protein
VALNSMVVMMGALWAGSYVLAFFGISLAALRVAGGLVVAISGWHMLNAPEKHEEHKQEQAASAEGVDDVAFFPLTIPFTTGPGTISVAVALGAGHPRLFAGLGWFFLGMTAAAAAMAVVVWLTYRSADQLAKLMGPSGSRTLTRVAAFLLLCIGVQILITGIQDVLGPLLGAPPSSS